MRPLFIVALLALGSTWTSAAAPAPTGQDALIDQIEMQTYGQFNFTSGSPLIGMMLQGPRQANPEATPETWKVVEAEVATGYLDLLTRKGGMLDQLLRPALASMTTAELKRLSVLLDDPAYRKYRTAMQSEEMQRSMQRAMLTAATQIGPMLNQILGRHGLHEVH